MKFDWFIRLCSVSLTKMLISCRYKQHKTDFEIIPSERPLLLPCRVKKCLCSAYEYLPHNGAAPVRCGCKHLPQDHTEGARHLCRKCESKAPEPEWAAGTIEQTRVDCRKYTRHKTFPFQVTVPGSGVRTHVDVASPPIITRPWSTTIC